MTNMYYKETWPINKWEIVDQKLCCNYDDTNPTLILAICAQVGELTTYEVNQLGTCPKHYPRLVWMPLDRFCKYKTNNDDTIIW